MHGIGLYNLLNYYKVVHMGIVCHSIFFPLRCAFGIFSRLPVALVQNNYVGWITLLIPKNIIKNLKSKSLLTTHLLSLLSAITQWNTSILGITKVIINYHLLECANFTYIRPIMRSTEHLKQRCACRNSVLIAE